jgi:hypothetical protein
MRPLPSIPRLPNARVLHDTRFAGRRYRLGAVLGLTAALAACAADGGSASVGVESGSGPAAGSSAPAVVPAPPAGQTEAIADAQWVAGRARSIASAVCIGTPGWTAAASVWGDAFAFCASPRVDHRPAQRVLLIGSSTMGGAIGVPLSRLLEASGVRVRNRGEASTGLARADHVDWKERVRDEIRDFRPDLVLAQIGGNDCQPIIAPDRDVLARRSDLEHWHRVYAQVLGELVATVRAEGVQVMLLDLQPARRPDYSECVAGINDVTRAVAQAYDLPVFSVWDATDGPDGTFTETLMIDGVEEDIRTRDGYHLATPGGRWVARQVYADLLQQGLVAPFSLR